MNQNIKQEYLDLIYDMEILNSTPEVLIKAMRSIDDPNISIEMLAEIIKRDIGLASEIIKLSNSSYYSFSTKSGSVTESIERVGLREVSRLLSIKLSNDLYAEDLKHYSIPAEIFWENSLSSAILMEEMGMRLSIQVSDAYICGLLSNAGTIVIDTLLTKLQLNCFWDKYEPVHMWEKKILGFDHTTAAVLLLNNWGFPESICNAVKNQYSQDYINIEDHLAKCLILTNRITELAGSDLSTPISNWNAILPISNTLDIGQSELENIVSDCESQLSQLHDAFFADSV